MHYEQLKDNLLFWCNVSDKYEKNPLSLVIWYKGFVKVRYNGKYNILRQDTLETINNKWYENHLADYYVDGTPIFQIIRKGMGDKQYMITMDGLEFLYSQKESITELFKDITGNSLYIYKKLTV